MHDLAVEQRVSYGNLGERRDNRWELGRPVVTTTADELGPAPREASDHAVAVELDLVLPFITTRCRRHQSSELRSHLRRQRRLSRSFDLARIDLWRHLPA